MDDGSLTNKTSCNLATCSFTIEEHEFLINGLKEFFDLEVKISRVSNGKEKYPILVFDRENSKKFLKLVKPFIIPSMMYKCNI